MNLGIEYLIRTGTIKDFLEAPCSLFCRTEENDKFVITLHEENTGYVIRHWKVFAAGKNLPPMEEFYTEDPFEDPRIKPSGSTLLEYQEEPVEDHDNYYNRPMAISLYKSYCEHFLNSNKHQRVKEVWLWRSFTKAANIKFERRVHFYMEYLTEAAIVEEKYPDDWRRWLVWRKHMLDFQGVPGELIFSSSCTCTSS